MKMTRIALAAASLVVCSFTAQAANVEAAPSPSQDPLVQHLKLSNEQVKRLKICISSWNKMSAGSR